MKIEGTIAFTMELGSENDYPDIEYPSEALKFEMDQISVQHEAGVDVIWELTSERLSDQ